MDLFFKTFQVQSGEKTNKQTGRILNESAPGIEFQTVKKKQGFVSRNRRISPQLFRLKVLFGIFEAQALGHFIKVRAQSWEGERLFSLLSCRYVVSSPSLNFLFPVQLLLRFHLFDVDLAWRLNSCRYSEVC